jgi:hypothetical protein
LLANVARLSPRLRNLNTHVLSGSNRDAKVIH